MFANENMVIFGLILSFIFFVISILLFIRLDIYHVICGLTGITARREIKQIRENNRMNGKKGYKSSSVNLQRGKITVPLDDNGQLVDMEEDSVRHDSKKSEQLARTLNRTESLEQQGSDLEGSEQTTVLANAVEPQSAAQETTVLHQQEEPLQQQGCAQWSPFRMELDETVTHTEETI